MRIRKFLQITKMVPMHVRDHHIGDRLRRQPQASQRFSWALMEYVAAFNTGFFVATTVDEHHPVVGHSDPNEEVQWHRHIVKVDCGHEVMLCLTASGT